MAPIRAICFVHLEKENIHDVLEKFKSFPEITHYSVITGEYSGFLEIEVDDPEELYLLYTKLDAIKGIRTTQTHVIMKRFKFRQS